MDDSFLSYYNDELKFIREMSGEFAREFPKIAGRLSLDAMGQDMCADPFVERMLEGFAFLSARVRQKQDSEFPRWTQAFFESVYPNYPNPVPSMGVVRIAPKLSEADLAGGFTIPKGTPLRSRQSAGEKTPCIFKTGFDVRLFPLALTSADYADRTLAHMGISSAHLQGVSAGVCLKFTTTAGPADGRLPISQLDLDDLDIHVSGSGDIPVRILEYLTANCVRILVRPLGAGEQETLELSSAGLSLPGLDSEENLLPVDARVFEPYRLLREYFACSKRFNFFRTPGLRSILKNLSGSGFELLFLQDRPDPYIQRHLDKDNFSLFCVPVINLFSKRLDRVQLSHGKHEYAVVPDKSKPYDYEVYALETVTGIGRTSRDERKFYPFYRVTDKLGTADAFYVLRRENRKLTDKEEIGGPKSSYLGSQVWLSVVDRQHKHLESQLRQLAISALCTNRHLPLGMIRNDGTESDFIAEFDLVDSISFVGSPTMPRPAQDEGGLLWRMITHLHPNFHSILDSDTKASGQALRDVLRCLLKLAIMIYASRWMHWTPLSADPLPDVFLPRARFHSCAVMRSA